MRRSMNGTENCLAQDLDAIISDGCIDWKALEGSTVLVTGATGLVGSMAVKALLHFGKARVIALVRSPEKAKRVFADEAENKNLRFHLGDVTQPLDIQEKVDYILHGASVTASKTMVEHPVQTLMTALKGTENVLELAKAQSVRSMVYISSMEVYGRTDPAREVIGEEDLGYIDVLNPRSSYSEGKRACECLCASYSSEFGVPVKIARLAQTFGAGVGLQEGRVFAQFAKSGLHGSDIVLHTQGRSVGNYCYTADVIRGLLCILTRGQDRQAYTVVNEETAMPIRDMARLVAERLFEGRVRVVFDIPENLAAMGYAPDSTMRLSAGKLRALGWAPQYNLEEMYRRMMAYWKLLEGDVSE